MTTYHYRIYTFHNGLGETVFRTKRVDRLWPQWTQEWVCAYVGGISGESVIDTSWHNDRWTSRGAVMAAIHEHATARARSEHFTQQRTLKLIITEDVPVEVSGK